MMIEYLWKNISNIFTRKTVVSKEALNRQLIETKAALGDILDPMVVDLLESDMVVASGDAFSKQMNKFSITGSNPTETLNNLLVTIRKLDTDITLLIKEVSFFPKNVTNRAYTPRQAYVISLINGISSFTLMTPNVLTYVTAKAFDEKLLPKIKMEDVATNIGNFGILYAQLDGDMADSLKLADKLPDIELDELNIVEFDTDVNTTKMITFDSFVLNPIYHFRIMLANKRYENYKSLSSERIYLASTLQRLELEQGGRSDPKLEKAIKYYKKQVLDIDKERREIEERSSK